jgi:hypothetical protein
MSKTVRWDCSIFNRGCFPIRLTTIETRLHCTAYFHQYHDLIFLSNVLPACFCFVDGVHSMSFTVKDGFDTRPVLYGVAEVFVANRSPIPS